MRGVYLLAELCFHIWATFNVLCSSCLMRGIILVDAIVFSQKNIYISYVFLVKPSIYFYTQMAIIVNIYIGQRLGLPSF